MPTSTAASRPTSAITATTTCSALPAPGIADDYNWTEEVMRIAGNYMNGLSLHYYTVPGTFEKKTAATGFDTNTYYETIRKALYMDELITRHTEIMSHYDPSTKSAWS